MKRNFLDLLKIADSSKKTAVNMRLLFENGA
jgi:hypothetical protein